jgi:hypothetical protein
MLLLYLDFLGRTSLPISLKHLGCGIFVAGVLAQSGGFFIHMTGGQPDQPSVGTTITNIGAVLLTAAIGVVVYGLATAGELPG